MELIRVNKKLQHDIKIFLKNSKTKLNFFVWPKKREGTTNVHRQQNFDCAFFKPTKNNKKKKCPRYILKIFQKKRSLNK